MAETPPNVPGVTIRRRLAVGGMGELFLGDRDGTPVVIKRLLPNADETHRALFQREGDALEALDSPHVVTLLGRGPGYLLLAYIDGTDLSTLLAYRKRRGRPVPIAVATLVLRDILTGLQHLHEATDRGGAPLGLVHRDVHPGNILVDRTGRAVLADLGVVRTEATDHKTTAGLKGTLGYMAPEQLHGRAAGPRADIYAAGLVAYELLTGVPARPLGAAGLAELLSARARLPTAPTALRSSVPAALETALMAALEPDVNARHATAGDWLDTLALDDEAGARAALGRLVATAADAGITVSPGRTLAPKSDETRAPPGPSASPSRRRRRRLGLALGVAGAGALAVVLGAGLWPADTTPERRGQRRTLAEVGPKNDRGPLEPTPIPVSPAVTDTVTDDEADAVSPEPNDTRTLVAAKLPTSRPIRPRPPRTLAPATVAVLHLRVVPRGGPIHVSGPGALGLAPQQLANIDPGAAQVIRLTGGDPPVKATLRVTRREDSISVSIGAPAGQVHSVKCGNAGPRQTPLRGLAVGGGGLTCHVSGSAGGTVGFLLAAGKS
ncbi:MAG: hypothetical protein ACI9MR_000890 [Myxococcota bacterium]|jgi:hypothetical protein